MSSKYHLQNRPNRELKDESEIKKILRNGKFTTVSLCRDNEPYIVTLSYGFDEGRNALYFHSARQGLKLDFLIANKKVCATVIEDGGYVMDECAHEYKSIVFWGEMHVVNDLDEKRYGMGILLNHLEEKDTIIAEKLHKSDQGFATNMEVLRLDIKEIHGKAGG